VSEKFGRKSVDNNVDDLSIASVVQVSGGYDWDGYR
jgi:hypothetical protein